MDDPLILDNNTVVMIEPTAPFNFDATLHKPDHFPCGDNDWQPGTRWQTMLWQGEPLGLVFRSLGSVKSPRVELSIFSQARPTPDFLEGLVREVTYRYNLQMDLGGFYRRFEGDPLLGPVIQSWLGMRPMSPGSLYDYLMIAIVLQNATVRRSVQMMQALHESCGRLLCFDQKQLYCSWAPEAIAAVSEQALRDHKLGYRAKSIQRVSGAFIRHEIDEDWLRGQALEVQRRALLDLYGVGPASVGYILFDVFHQMDDMRYISPWEQKIYSRLFFNERFGGYRMLAVHYFWEDLFWKRKNESVDWLEELIRL